MFWCGCEVERWLQHRKHGEGWDSRDSRDSRPRSCTVPSPPLAPLPAERSGSESDITASWSPWTRARWSKMIRCEKAKKEAKKRKEANYEFFVQQKMFFARDFSDLKGLWSFPGGQSPRRSDRPEAGPSGIMNLVSLVLWSCHLGSQSFWALQMWKQGLRVDNVDD